MPASPKRRRAMLLGLLLCGATGAALAQFDISNGEAQLNKQTLTVSASLELSLSDKAEEALSKGIPLEVITNLRLVQRRRWLWDRQLGAWSLKHRIRYHALSGQYLVSGKLPDIDATESFTSLQEALRYMGNIEEIDLALLETPPAGKQRYRLQLRTSLDIEALPAPLRPVAYTSPAWHLNSGWSTWKVQN